MESLAPPWNVLKDFQQYDPGSNTWTLMPELPQFLTEAVAFSIGSKAYVVTGRGLTEELRNSNIYIWNTTSGNWTIEGPVPPACKRIRAAGFAIGEKGYIATGIDTNQTALLNDLWEYDPATCIWTRKADFPGVPRYDATCFVIENKAYITNGSTMESTSNTNDLWEYDPDTDIWTEKAGFPGSDRSGAFGFSIGDRGYVVTGASWQLVLWERWTWEYDPVSDTWRKLDLFPGTVRIYASGFVVSGKAYLSPGWFFTPSDDTWEYTPPPGGWDQKGVSYRFFPNPAHEKLTILTVGSPELTSIELLDFSGRKLCSISPRPFDFYHRFVLKMISAGCINRNYTIPEGG
jgi:hypothetical protein